jgi:hypothetical protein|tara:strand:+ start:13586 stop:13885 length:300 start_codon:yes stop_codon:yes gene_type:complete
MKFNKGDLIVINNVDNKKISCIILTIFEGAKYLYVYCIDLDSYRLVYEKEVDFVVDESFYPQFPMEPDFWNIDYSFYEMAQGFPYTPFYSFGEDDDDSD